LPISSRFETLNREDFLPLIREAFADTNWEKAYEEFRADAAIMSRLVSKNHPSRSGTR
jgi:hypothetical protein